jgi:iron complex transport system substrate-binding protein
MRVPIAAAAVSAALLCVLLGCNRGATSAASGESSKVGTPAATKPSTREVSHPPDYVISPIVDKRDGACTLRIVSLAPSVTESCCALGLRENLVGRSGYCDYPPGIESTPSVGSLVDASMERLVSLEPDLVLIPGHSGMLSDQFDRLGLKYESLPDTTFEDIRRAITKLGELTGRTHSATRLVDRIDADLDRVAAMYRGRTRKNVLLLIGRMTNPPSPPHVAGPGSFYDDLIRRAGAENAASELGKPFPVMSLEVILAINPDVIIELDGDADPNAAELDREAEQNWWSLGSLSAVQEHHIHVLAGPQHLIPGPRVAQTFAALCRIIYGPRDRPASDQP